MKMMEGEVAVRDGNRFIYRQLFGGGNESVDYISLSNFTPVNLQNGDTLSFNIEIRVEEGESILDIQSHGEFTEEDIKRLAGMNRIDRK